MVEKNSVVVQLGEAASYCGSHFWNLLYYNSTLVSSGGVSHECLSSVEERFWAARREFFWEPDEGPTAGQVVPRLVALDDCSLDCSEAPISRALEPHEDPISKTLWTGPAERLSSSQHDRRHAFQVDRQAGTVKSPDAYNFEESVRHWTDFQAFPLSSRSKIRTQTLLHDLESTKASSTTFAETRIPDIADTPLSNQFVRDLELFQRGYDAVQSKKQSEELLDAVRYFAETCDSLTGFDIHGSLEHAGNGGVLSGLVEELSDLFGTKKNFLIFSIDPKLDVNVGQIGEALLVSSLYTSSASGENDHIAYLPVRARNLRNTQRERLWTLDARGLSFEDLTCNSFGWTASVATALAVNRILDAHPLEHRLRVAMSGNLVSLRHRCIFDLRAGFSPFSLFRNSVESNDVPTQNFDLCNLSTAGWLRQFVDKGWCMRLKQRLPGFVKQPIANDESTLPEALSNFCRALDTASIDELLNQKSSFTSESKTVLMLPHPFPREIRRYAAHGERHDDQGKSFVHFLHCRTRLEQSRSTGADIHSWALQLWCRACLPNLPHDPWSRQELATAAERLLCLAEAYHPSAN